MAEYVLPLIGLVGGLVLFLVLVAVLLVPPLRRFTRARAALGRSVRSGVLALRIVRPPRRPGA